VTPNRQTIALDVQLWPLLLPDAPPAWRAALATIRRTHAVDGGYDFNDDRDGVWTEGTAQAALVARLVGDRDEFARLLSRVTREKSPGGYLWATNGAKVTTGFAIGPDSRTDDFTYLHLPHLGATSWAVLAALGWNPFTGKRVP
jgi:hypothetical protein